MTTWVETIQALQNSTDLISSGTGVTPSDIQKAETILSVKFPEQLVIYFLTFGHLDIAHRQLYGLGSNIPKYLDLVLVTQEEQAKYRPYIPKHLLPMENDGGGSHYCIDLSNGLDDPPVVYWNHEKDEEQVPEVEASSFSAWIIEAATYDYA